MSNGQKRYEHLKNAFRELALAVIEGFKEAVEQAQKETKKRGRPRKTTQE